MGKSFSEYSAGEIYKLGGVKVALEGDLLWGFGME
jgi:hypothetical protein